MHTVGMRRLLYLMCAALALAGAWSAAFHGWTWLYAIGVHPYPASSSTPWTYQLLSGFVPSLAVLTLASGAAAAWRHVNCHQDGCWHLGRHKVDGTPWCDRHHENARPEANERALLQMLVHEVVALRSMLDTRL